MAGGGGGYNNRTKPTPNPTQTSETKILINHSASAISSKCNFSCMNEEKKNFINHWSLS